MKLASPHSAITSALCLVAVGYTDTNNHTLTITDSGSTAAVVLNVKVQNGEFNNGITLGAGLNANDVIINLLGQGEFQNAANGATQSVTYIDEDNTINVESPIDGHVFGGGGRRPGRPARSLRLSRCPIY